MKSSFFQAKKRTWVLSEPESLGTNDESSSNEDNMELASTAPQLRILINESRAANEKNDGANQSDNQTLHIAANGITQNNINSRFRRNTSTETVVNNPLYAERERQNLALGLDCLDCI